MNASKEEKMETSWKGKMVALIRTESRGGIHCERKEGYNYHR